MPKEFFNEIWLIKGNHEYIDNAEIKRLEPIYLFRWNFRGKTFISRTPKMLIYAN